MTPSTSAAAQAAPAGGFVAAADILAAIRFRHACKNFDPERRIPDEDFALIVEAGRLSPSSFGLEPWQFLVIANKALREKLQPNVWGGRGQLPTASHLVVILARTGQDMRFDSAHIDRHLREQEKLTPDLADRRRAVLGNFQENEFHLLGSERALADWAARQCYIPLANMMTVAALRGIDSCPIEGFNADAVGDVLGSDFGVDRDHFRPAVLVAFGYRAGPQPAKRRLPAERTVRWFV